MSDSVNLFEYLDYRVFLRDVFHERKRVNAGFSSRSVAYRLKCNPGFFSRVLKGSRNLSPDHVFRLGEILKLDKRRQRYFELLVQYNQAKKQAERDHYFGQLEMFRSTKVKDASVEQYAMVSHWYYVVLRELLHFISCSCNSDDAVRKLAKSLEPPVKLGEAREALTVLEELGVIRRTEKGTYEITDQFVSAREIPRVVVNRYLIEFMQLAQESIDRFNREERSLSTLTFSVSPKGYERIKDRLDEFRREVLAIVDSEDEPQERVYHMNLHLFPVSKPRKGAVLC